MDLGERYLDYPSAFRAVESRLAAEREADLAFIRSQDGGFVVEGPWGDIPPMKVAYVGLRPNGEYVKLDQICSLWRFKPAGAQLASGVSVVVVPATDELIVQRILIGRELPGILITVPTGQAPVQADGLIDGKEFYFRARGSRWALNIGGSDVVSEPDWRYFEEYGTGFDAGFMTQDEAYAFIEAAAVKYRQGLPTMMEE